MKKISVFLLSLLLLTSCTNNYKSRYYDKKDTNDHLAYTDKKDIKDDERKKDDSKENKDKKQEKKPKERILKRSDDNFKEVLITRVVDGDTAVYEENGKEVKLRFIGVNTPETVHPFKEEEPFGKEASDFTKKYLTDKIVYLEKDVSDIDKYNRALRYIWLEVPSDESFEEVEKKMFTAKLLQEGLATLDTYPPDVKYVDYFKKLQRKAQADKKNIWSGKREQKENEENNYNEGKIKGNKNSKIYHMSDGKYYDSISKSNTIYFDSEGEAINNGYRKSKV